MSRMINLNARKLSAHILVVMQDVLVHQWPKWSHLFLHKHQYEGWWKAELRSALDAFCWQIPSPGMIGILSEVRPRDYEIGTKRESIDLVVGTLNRESGEVDLHSGPRISIELKERGTWWDGGPKKALGEVNCGLRSDLRKWSNAPWTERDVVVACQIISHWGNATEALPADWRDELDLVARANPRCTPPRSVGCPSWNSEEVLWATIELFSICGLASVRGGKGSTERQRHSPPNLGG